MIVYFHITNNFSLICAKKLTYKCLLNHSLTNCPGRHKMRMKENSVPVGTKQKKEDRDKNRRALKIHEKRKSTRRELGKQKKFP